MTSPLITWMVMPEPVVPPLLSLARLRVAARIHEARVRVERLQQAGDGAVDDPVGFDVADVDVLDGAEAGGEDLVLLGDLILGRQRGVSEQAAQHDRGTAEQRLRSTSEAGRKRPPYESTR